MVEVLHEFAEVFERVGRREHLCITLVVYVSVLLDVQALPSLAFGLLSGRLFISASTAVDLALSLFFSSRIPFLFSLLL